MKLRQTRKLLGPMHSGNSSGCVLRRSHDEITDTTVINSTV